MASTSFEEVEITGMPADFLRTPEVYVVPCPLHRSLARMNVCEKCQHHKGYGRIASTGNDEHDLRIVCSFGTMRAIRLVDRDPFVACPLQKGFRLVTLKNCETCELHGGIKRRPRTMLDRILGRGIPFIYCKHPNRRHFERLA